MYLDEESLLYTLPVNSDELGIGSIYNYSNTTTPASLLSAYTSFHWSYYFAIISTFLTFSLAWACCSYLARTIRKRLKRELVRANLPAWWIMTCAILDQDQYPKVSRIAFTILSLCFTEFFYLFIDCYMLNQIRTDLIVIKEPQVIHDYYDLIRREKDSVYAVFREGSPETKFFENAPDGTPESEVWKRRLVIESYNNEEYIRALMAQKHILIFRMVLLIDLVKLLLEIAWDGKFGYSGGNLRALIIRDPTGKSWINSFMINPRSDPRIVQYINHM